MIWEMRISAFPKKPVSDLPDLLDGLLETLEASPSVLGAATFGDRRSGEIGARYDLEAEHFEQAMNVGAAIFNRAIRDLRIPSVTVQHVEVTAEREPATASATAQPPA